MYSGFRIFGALILLIGVAVVLMMNDTSSASARIQRCPKCGKRSLCKRKPEDKQFSADSNWICSQCGNDTDEFGNKL